MRRTAWVRWVSSISVLALAASACGGDDDEATVDPAPGPSVVIASDFEFDTEVVEVTAGAQIVVELRNTGGLEHTWAVLNAGIDLATADDMPDGQILASVAGRSGTVTFTGPPAGDYQIICTIAGHLEAGMEATLRSLS